MNPSETPRGIAWLENFLDDERPMAQMLIDSLDLVGQDRLRNGVHGLVTRLSQVLRTPIALVPVREVVAGYRYYKGDRNAKANIMLKHSLPGSEAIIANIATGLRRELESGGSFTAAPSLSNLRDAKCRAILFLDDFSGSGDRIIAFDNAFRRHPTMQSWLSYGLLQIHVAAFAITNDAEQRLKRHFGQNNVHPLHICPTFASQKWTPSEEKAIKALCRKYYCPKVSVGPFGYNNGKALMAFSHSVPNNIPPILWQKDSPAVNNWNRFFAKKAVPDELSSIFGDTSPFEKAEQVLHRLGQIRLVSGGWRNAATGDTTKILMVLAAVARRPRSFSRILELTGLSSLEVERMLNACRGWKLVGPTNRITDAGLRELAHAKKISLRDEISPLQGSDESYYPRMLRVGR